MPHLFLPVRCPALPRARGRPASAKTPACALYRIPSPARVNRRDSELSYRRFLAENRRPSCLRCRIGHGGGKRPRHAASGSTVPLFCPAAPPSSCSAARPRTRLRSPPQNPPTKPPPTPRNPRRLSRTPGCRRPWLQDRKMYTTHP